MNRYGQLGTGNHQAANKPKLISRCADRVPIKAAKAKPPRLELKNVVSVAAGDRHSVALTSDGTVYTWGDGAYGQLGHGPPTSTGQDMKLTCPTLVSGLEVQRTPAKIKEIVCGSCQTTMLSRDGKVFVCGSVEK